MFLKGLADLREHPEVMQQFMLDGDGGFLVPPNCDAVSPQELAAWLPDVQTDAPPRLDGLYYTDVKDYTKYIRFHDDGFFSMQNFIGSTCAEMFKKLDPSTTRGERGAWTFHNNTLSAFLQWSKGTALYRFEGPQHAHSLSLATGHQSELTLSWWPAP